MPDSVMPDSVLGLAALIVAAVFAGAAAYINLVEQPARLTLQPGPLLTQWKIAYKRGYAMQAPLAAVGFVLGLAASLTTGEPGFMIGGLLMLANWPWTLAGIMPLNNRLMAFDPAEPPAEVPNLIRRWGHLHAVRTYLGAAALAAFVWANL